MNLTSPPAQKGAARAPHHHHLDVGVVGALGHLRLHESHHVEVERVERLGTVERDVAHLVDFFELDGQ